ncbi:MULTISPECIES: tRNA (cytidine(34)-2'-O)-methyltransferase [unclassified Cellulophaga]|uniref:tRNA (cytidine(34)-2'-O)-methyltransferase n=1 Tax=unclassified Cellulophaga TaxID=2634405 RepID=UPI0026E439B0|nr:MULTISPECIES: tRNA (cytidine(34)-2'-O)-methyltransferase [unclassified Cellulophaga]MDO6491765.1 tRNA (cytidine(34)-2'-O)-methyltransferase [Cellulophaga sp. 2_MG-2023]MDO6495580.1 tRNA (cytidine(34)-2'-O)-methyltransferase [Cellulophaga sp. 3_MG-2023]
MSFNIVLFEPEIPNNTGNIGRLSLASGSTLHLVKPFGFELDDKRVKRAGLDYWKHLDLKIYDSIDHFFEVHSDKKFTFLSAKAEKNYYEIDYEDNMFFVFGKESKGLPKSVVEKYKDSLYKIPLFSEHIRSLNLANAVSIVIYDAIKSKKL